jgi:hypothetical protein
MESLREQANADLGFTLEGEFALPVELIDDAGKLYTTNFLTGETLGGQILYDTNEENPDTGSLITSNEPIVVLKKDSLERVPKPGEKWVVRIPVTPSTTAPKESFIVSKDRPPEGGNSLGIIRLYLQRNRQS